MLLCWISWLTYFWVFTLFFLFCYCEGNLGCINSAYGDVRYMVYIWGLPYLDYPLDVSISWIHNLSLYNQFCPHLYLKHAWCLISWLCMSLLTTQFSNSDLSIHVYLLDFRFNTDSLISIYVTVHCLYLHACTTSLDHLHMCFPVHATWLHLTYALGYFLTTLDLHI